MKHLISFITRKVPRKYLQYISHIVLRIWAVFLRGNQVECPIDGKTYKRFLPYGRIHPRSNALCPSSLSLERHRLMWLYLKERTNFFGSKLNLLHIAPELCFIDRFEGMDNIDYVTVDMESPLAKVKADIMALPFDDETFDVVFCNHVMEHVEDDIKAMKELLRVMKVGAWAIIQSPVYMNLAQTIEDPGADTPAKREQLYDQKDHMRKYGRDYSQRLATAGFKVTEDHFAQQLPQEQIKRYALPREEIIYFCEKM